MSDVDVTIERAAIALIEASPELARLLAVVPSDVPGARLPHGHGATLAAVLGWPERSGASRLSQVWTGALVYRPVAKIF